MAGPGYSSYFLVLLGSWKVLGAIVLLVPRRALPSSPGSQSGSFDRYGRQRRGV